MCSHWTVASTERLSRCSRDAGGTGRSYASTLIINRHPASSTTSPAQGQNLSTGQTWANTVNVPANEAALIRILPGKPDSSYLVHKIQGTQAAVGGFGGQMPLGKSPLSQGDIDKIRAWIQAGALNN